MRADPANSNGDVNAGHVVDEEEEKHTWIYPQVEGSRHIVYASGSSRYGEALDLLHLPTVLPPDEEDSVPQTKEEARDDGPR